MKYVVRENTAMHAICDAKFTSRTSVYRAPFKGSRVHSYTVAHGDFVRRRRFENRIDITSPTRLATLAILAARSLHLRAKQSHLLILVHLAASLNAARVASTSAAEPT